MNKLVFISKNYTEFCQLSHCVLDASFFKVLFLSDPLSYKLFYFKSIFLIVVAPTFIFHFGSLPGEM